MQIEDDEILQGFIEESLEHLADIENDLLQIEEGGENIDEDLVNKVFRAAHSIKGGAGFMGLTVIQDLAHSMENVLGLIRSCKLVPTPGVINVLLSSSDKLNTMIEDVSNSNDYDIEEHVVPLTAIYEGDAVAPAGASVEETTAETNPEPVSELKPEVAVTPPSPLETPPVPVAEVAPEPVSVPEPTPEPPKPPTSGPKAVQSKAQKDKKPAAKVKVDSSIRVHVSLLDSLMTLAGELVLSRNQLLQTIISNDVRNAETVGQRIDLITSELQEAIMLTRMQPIGNVFGKFPRVVRDLSGKLKKDIELIIVGKDVELDKTIIESINDPLTHLVRNSVDHGIELPDERIAAGKPVQGTVTLKAYHAAGQVVIEISDDGKGLDGDALAEVAVSKDLLTTEQVESMSTQDKINLIFLPGFSTAKEVTDVSGRGVGMDVVKTNLDQLGGQVDIISEIGLGTTISIKLPLTLAIIPCQIIMAGGERYAIPQVNLEELLRIPAAQVKDRVERVGTAEVVRLRGNLLPLIRLADVLDIKRSYFNKDEDKFKDDRRERISDRRGYDSSLSVDEQNETDELTNGGDKDRELEDRRIAAASALNIVVVSAGSIKYGLIVDKLQDSEEIVIKPLGKHLQGCKGYAGATIMGDGRIALILDVTNLSIMAELTSMDGSDRAAEVAHAADETINAKKDKQALLTFRSSEKEQFAVPLNQVERISYKTSFFA